MRVNMKRAGALSALAALLLTSLAVASLAGADDRRTAPPPNPPTASPPQPVRGLTLPATIAVAGDICGRAGPETCAPTAQLILARDPDVVITAGDNQYTSGTLEEYLGSYDKTWGRFKDRTRPAPGNHEWKDGVRGYRSYFGPSVLTDGGTWYSFNVGRWHLISLDGTCASNGGCGPGSPQLGFLRQDLQDTRTSCVLAYWHQPRFSSGSNHGSSEEVDPMWDALWNNGADLVLNGHEHNYERFAPRHGMVEIVSGTGGAGSYPFGTPLAGSEFRLTDVQGVTFIHLTTEGWTSRFVDVSGAVRDTATGSC